jgi:hypothetical protein
VDVAAHIGKYLGNRSPVERASSFDYCFNYFQGFKDRSATNDMADPHHLELSCLHLGYYLASWGMLRGSTALHTKSYRFFEPVVEAIAAEPIGSWSIDTDSYGDATIAALLETRDRLATALTPRPVTGTKPRAATNTLVTKVMLGVFGSVPAFDTFFVRGLRVEAGRGLSFGQKALATVADFYQRNSAMIDGTPICTLDATTGNPTARPYTRAKIIDMVFLIEGGGS